MNIFLLATLSQTNLGWSVTLSRPLANQPEKYSGWSARGRDLSQTNQKLVCDTVATNHELHVRRPWQLQTLIKLSPWCQKQSIKRVIISAHTTPFAPKSHR